MRVDARCVELCDGLLAPTPIGVRAIVCFLFGGGGGAGVANAGTAVYVDVGAGAVRLKTSMGTGTLTLIHSHFLRHVRKPSAALHVDAEA